MSRHSLSISSFKKNLIFIGKLLFFGLLVFGYINHIMPEYAGGYNSALIDKVNRLESIDGPKIVLLGNSNLAFGMDSSMLEEAFGMPVVNMGLHGGAGNAFHEEMCKFNVTEGDIYIISHNDFVDNDTIVDTMVVWTSIENNYHLWKTLRLKDIPDMAKGFPVYLKKCLNLYVKGTGNMDTGEVYARSAFNEYGDVGLLRENSEYELEGVISPSGISDITVNRINKLNKWLNERGATLLVAGYPIGNGNMTADADEFILFQEELKKKLDCAVISNYTDYMFDYTYFFDGIRHLNTFGAELRTQQLILDLQRWKETGTDADIEDDIYENIVQDVTLSHITDINEYLEALAEGKERYSILIAAKDEASAALSPEIIENMKKLGLDALLENQYRASYLAVIDKGTVIEKAGYEQLTQSGILDDGNIAYDLVSAGYDVGDISSILINGKQYSQNFRGLNIVVYSNETHRILDIVTFDTCFEELEVMRNHNIRLRNET